ncbi:MAG: NUDIX hydrolase [Lysobacterales bacterium]|jgi:8-oxo-dGTP pyrophosphatase MutT (NUDIX family)|nr:MAG: NUDIX hydrolase [Xanthomonadales bacterium]
MTEGIRRVYSGRVLELNVETVRLPNGRVAELEIAHHPGGAAIVAVDAAGRVCLLRQYRHAAGGWLVELPAGKLDGGEPPLECARRELAEEAGVTAGRWEKLGEFLSSPGVLTETIHLYLARDLAADSAVPEEHEVLEAGWVPAAEAFRQAASGEIHDAKSVIGLLWARERLGPDPGKP